MCDHLPAEIQKRQKYLDHFKPFSKQKYEKKCMGSSPWENISLGS